MAKATQEEQTYPRTFLWEEDGEDLGDRRRVRGRFVTLDEAPTKQGGLKPILVLEIDREQRSVWMLHEPFLNKLTEELERRPSGEFTPGEEIVVEQWKEKKIGEASGRPYVPYKVAFPERPKRSQKDILGARKPASDVIADESDFANADEQVATENGQDEDIPF
jgi:hypothetical protein